MTFCSRQSFFKGNLNQGREISITLQDASTGVSLMVKGWPSTETQRKIQSDGPAGAAKTRKQVSHMTLQPQTHRLHRKMLKRPMELFFSPFFSFFPIFLLFSFIFSFLFLFTFVSLFFFPFFRLVELRLQLWTCSLHLLGSQRWNLMLFYSFRINRQTDPHHPPLIGLNKMINGGGGVGELGHQWFPEKLRKRH